MDNPSQHEANHALRVLSGKPLKFTIRIHKPDGSVIEFQAEGPPKVVFNTEARTLWIEQYSSAYTNPMVCPFEPGMIILTEENPKP